jgi:SAM-dependent methyltransferase
MKIDEYYQEDRYREEMIGWRNEEYYPWRLDMLISKLNIKLKGRVLDAGCGDGGLAKEIKEKFPKTEIYGIDISKEGCRLAKKYCLETKVVDLNKKIPYPDNYFDYIVSQEVLEHILDTDNYFEEFNRVLKKGGRAIITTPNLLAWYQRMFCLIGIVPSFSELSTRNRKIGLGVLNRVLHNTQPVGHIRVFTSKGIVDMAKLYNFKVLAIKTSPIKYFFPKPLQYIYDGMDWFFSQFSSLGSNLVLYIEKNKTA